MQGKQGKDGRVAARRAAVSLAALVMAAGFLFWRKPDSLYLWIKAIHVVAIIAWMAGLLYLPRLFVYHADVPKGSEQFELFKTMEKRLLKVIMNPAMIIAWVLGLWLAWDGFGFQGGWLHVKLAAVAALTVFHVYLARSVRDFADDSAAKSARHWRMVNEIPTVLMLVIVVLVIVKPF